MSIQKTTTRSREIYQASCAVMPGGVSSPVRAFRSVGGDPVVIARAAGAYMEDVDGQRYLDYVGSWGPMLFGHADPEVVAALQDAVTRGTSYGCPTELELLLCRQLTQMIPSVEMVRLVNSGTEAAMSALRAARGFTGRPKVIKFRGCYHGHVDSLLVQAGSGLATFGQPSSAGVPAETVRDTLSVEFNDAAAVEAAFARYPDQIAAVVLEPIVGNMGCVPPLPGYLEALRDLCTRHGALLVFDEVMTGFRVGPSGAQGLYNITPDLTVLGKIIGGGLPVGAYGGRRDIMSMISPLGPIYQAGTLSGNPLATTAGLTTLRRIAREADTLYPRLEALSAKLADGLRAAAEAAGLPATLNRVGSMMTLFFAAGPVTDFNSAAQGTDERYAAFFHAMLDRGIYLAPSRFECAFVSAAHTEANIDLTIAAAYEAAHVAAQTP
jgi:glutamate-1-semialdehyde 2,1-aminomutase